MAYDPLEQIPWDDDEIVVDNPEPRCPCLLLLDTSGSMEGEPIRQLNNGVATLKRSLVADSLASKRVEVGIVTFGPPRLLLPFTTVDSFDVPTLKASGTTPLGGAIQMGLEAVRKRKDWYRQVGLNYFRPWVMLITDGAPDKEDNWREAARLIREGEASKAFAFFAVGVDKAEMSVLKECSVRQPLKLRELKFEDLFQWLSSSLTTQVYSQDGAEVRLKSPEGWAVI